MDIGPVGGPMLLVGPSSLPNVAQNYLVSVRVGTLRVYGGTSAVADDVVSAAQASAAQ